MEGLTLLDKLYIKNVALIDKAILKFSSGFNILSGETGAGKSIIIGSILFVFGARANKDFIKKDKEEANVEVNIIINSKEIIDYLKENDIELNKDGGILISRTYTKSSKNICKINNKTVTISLIKELSKKLIDIHGQHEHQSLLNPKKHMFLLDKFCDENIEILKDKLFKNISGYKELLKEFASLSFAGNKDEKIDFLNFQINEIEDANLKIGEEEELLKKVMLLSKASDLKYYSNEALKLLKNSSEEKAALDKIASAINFVKNISAIDNKELLKELEDIYTKLDEVCFTIRKFEENIEDNEEELNYATKRLDTINKLKKKYGNDIKAILAFYENAKAKLEEITNIDEKVLALNKQKEKLEIKIKDLCQEIRQIRLDKAKELEIQIENNLKDLGMKDIKFKINITDKNTFSKNGFDNVEFLIATNLGEKLKPLAKIASGGEMSRIMLSLKSILSVFDSIETFIFDEIDTGISGRTAQMVAEKMAFLSKENQILVITHLPQIAAMADTHFLIEKSTDISKNNTNTKIHLLNQEEIINEIARMNAGASITDFTIASSKEMLNQAKIFKENINKNS